jgi:hypothetical protein
MLGSMRPSVRALLATAAAISVLGAGCGASGRPASHAGAATAHQHVGFMVVEKSGVTQDADGAGGYGLVIDNPTTRDALWVSLYIHLLDARSHVVATQTQNLILMPADNTYYVGGSFTARAHTVTRVAVTGIIRRSVPYRYALPSVTNLRLVKGPDESEQVVGSVVNLLGATLSRDDPMGIVFFDAHGNVVGGAAGILGQAVPGTNQRTFRVPIRASPRVRSVGVTLGELVASDRREPTQPVSA